jgi:hypothetical protein
MDVFMPRQAILCLLVSVVVLATAAAPRLQAEMIVGHNGLSNLGQYTGTVTYADTDSTHATLTVSLKNTSPALNGGFLTAFVFNNPSDLITGVTLSGGNGHFSLLGGPSFHNGINGAPFGHFDIGASTGGGFEGGPHPTDGLGVGKSATFTFALTGSHLDTLTTDSFFAALSANPQGKGAESFVARFRAFNHEGSDKVPDDVVRVQNPEPATLALLGAGLACVLGGVTMRRKRALAS